MDKKLFLAVTLCAGIFLLWQNLYLKPYQEQQSKLQHAQQQVQTTQQIQPNPTSTAAKSAPQKTAQAEVISMGNGMFSATILTHGGMVSNVNLPEYRGRKTDNLAYLIGGRDQLELTTPSPEWAYLSAVNYTAHPKQRDSDGTERLVLSYEDANVAIERTYRINPALFYIDHDISVQFKKQPAPAYLFVGFRALSQIPKEHEENERRQVYFNKSGGQEVWAIRNVDAVKEDLGEGNWMGLSSRYFLNALLNRDATVSPQFQARPLGDGQVAMSLIYKVSGSSMRVPVRMYYGPKDVDLLKSVGKRLEAAVDFGWFTVFAYPLLKALKWFYGYVHNFGIAIILLTVLVKLLTYPLTLKSMKSMKEMQRIQPQLTRLRERHQDDKEKLNKEMLQLMRANGYNPMSGCLPIFIQMPIFIALYNVLYGAIDLYGQPFFGWIHDLSAKDPYYVTPILLALMMFLQQKLTPNTATDPAQQKMMALMPVIFGFMMLWLPAGLTLYMLVNSVVSIVQQFVMNRTINARSGDPVVV